MLAILIANNALGHLLLAFHASKAYIYLRQLHFHNAKALAQILISKVFKIF